MKEVEFIYDTVKEIKEAVAGILTQTTATNGRVTRNEEAIKALIISSTNLMEALKAQSERIKTIEDRQTEAKDKELEKLRETNTKWKERLMWGIVTTLLFLLGIAGVISNDFIKLFI